MPPCSTNSFSAAAPFSPMPPTYSGGIEPARWPLTICWRALIRDHDGVEALPQVAGLHVGVQQRLGAKPKSSKSQRVQPSSMLGL